MKKLQNTSVKVYYDSTCPLCTAFKVFSEKGTNEQEVQFQNVQTDTTPNNLSETDLLAEIYAIDTSGNTTKGSDAIFTILKKHKWLNWLGYLGTLPVIRQCARPVYRVIAAQRHFIFGPLSRIFWIRIITIVGLLTGILLSLPLWIGDRIIPTVPVLHFSWVDTASATLFVVLIPSLLWAMFSTRPSRALLLSVCILLSLTLLDQNRLQPWVYQYGAILLLISTYSWNAKRVLEQEKLLNVLSIMLASIYVYSGIQKINPVFFTSIYPWMVEPYLHTEYFLGIILIGLFVPFIEIFIGIGLLIKSTRTLALFGTILMLVFVLITLGPLGNNWNMVVWPWNIIFTVLALVLFCHNGKNLLQFFSIPKTVTSYVIVVLFAICPILFFFNVWDSYPSFSLYSGQTPALLIRLHTDFELPTTLAPYKMVNVYGETYLGVTQLAIDDIHVPVYPERRVQTVVAKKICTILENDKRVVVEFIPRLYWSSKHELRKYSCTDLNSTAIVN